MTDEKQPTTIENNQNTPKQPTLNDMSNEQLKVLCFDITEQIKHLQSTYQAVYNELVKRQG